jgi:DNA-binding beta-propeller fold protein YncE
LSRAHLLGVVWLVIVVGSQLAGGAFGSRTAETGQVRTVKLGAAPVALARGSGSLWVLAENDSGAVVLRLDPTTGARRALVRVGSAGPDVGAIAVSQGRVWAVAGSTLLRLDPSRPGALARATLPGVASAVAAGPSGVWVVTIGSQDLLVHLNPRSLAVLAQIVIPVEANSIEGPTPLALAFGSVWLADGESLLRIDPVHNRLSGSFPAVVETTDMTFARGRLWTLVGGAIRLLDGRGRLSGRLGLPFAGGRFAIGGDRLWATDNCGCPHGTLAELDLETGRVVETRRTGETPVALVADQKWAWVASFGDGTVARYGVT